MIKYRKILFTAILVLMVSPLLLAQHVEKKKKLTKQFAVSNNTTVYISNKYGKVEVNPWDKDSVSIVIRVSARAKNNEKLEKMMGLIKFRFATANGYLKISTQIGSSKNDIISEINDLTNAVFTIGSEATIDYTVRVPIEAKLNITNSFGDILLNGDYKNPTINLSHGDLHAGFMMGNTYVRERFGKAYISRLNNATLSFEYADLVLETADEIKLNSKSSDIEINHAQTVFLNSSRDKIRIDKATSVSGKATMTKFNLSELVKSMDIQTRLGSVSLDKISTGFSKIFIVSSYTDITLFFPSANSFSFFSRQADTDFSFPAGSELKKVLIDKDKKVMEYSGSFGSKPSPASEVRVDCTKGELKLFFR